MSIQKMIFITILCLAITSPGLSEDNSVVKYDYGPVYAAMDQNNDGEVDKEEWFAAGLVQHTYDYLFQQLDKNTDLVVTESEFTRSSPAFEVDANKDGMVSLEEYVEANNKEAAKAEGDSSEGVAKMVSFDLGHIFDAIDANKDGRLTKEEWLGSGLNNDTYVHVFSYLLDADQDGTLTKNEYLVPMEDGTELVRAMDPDNDGKISLEEYIAAQNKTVPTGPTPP